MSNEQSSTRGRAVRSVGTRQARAFTLPELLVVIGIIALLVTIMVPSMSQTIHVARDRICRDHLYRIGQVAHNSAMNVTGTLVPFGLPGSDAWVGPVAGVDKVLLLCPEDPNNGATVNTDDELQKYYILQNPGPGGCISNLGAAFGIAGGILDDGQFWVNKPQTAHVNGAHPCYCKNPVRQSNQEIAGVCSEAIIVITTGSGGQKTITSVIGCTAGPGRGSSSEHYLMKGTCTDPSQCLTKDTKIMRLGGATYTTVDSPYQFCVSATSYGMSYKIDCPTVNTHVASAQMTSPNQVMTMDANTPQLKVGEAGWMGHVFDRHFGKVNYVTTGGSVTSTTKAQLTDEYNRLEDKGDTGGSLFGSRATPVAKD